MEGECAKYRDTARKEAQGYSLYGINAPECVRGPNGRPAEQQSDWASECAGSWGMSWGALAGLPGWRCIGWAVQSRTRYRHAVAWLCGPPTRQARAPGASRLRAGAVCELARTRRHARPAPPVGSLCLVQACPTPCSTPAPPPALGPGSTGKTCRRRCTQSRCGSGPLVQRTHACACSVPLA